jgi:hypothetical protein
MTSWKPDVLLLNCYEMEKIKQDAPEIYKLLKSKDKSLPPVNPNIMPMLPGMPGLIPPTPKNIPNNMANFNLNLPMDVAKQLIEFLESQGIDLIGPDFSDNDSSEDISDEEMIDELTEDQGFGNNLDDWSSDPQDYLK